MTEILVVDDSMSARTLLRRQLETAGHAVYEAADGEEALELLHASERPLVVLLDVVMPRLGGVGVLTAVDSTPKLTGRHAYLLITGHTNTVPLPAVVEMLERLGVPTLNKPISTPELLQAVAQAESRLAQTPRNAPDSLPSRS